MQYFLDKIWAIFFCAVLLTTGSPAIADNISPPPTTSLRLLQLFIAVEGDVSAEKTTEYLSELDDFVAHLRRKQAKYASEKKFLSYLFYKVHRKYLKRYQDHTTLYELLERGRYDCVTGTALYALLLEALQINYQVQELPYHVYLNIYLTNGDTVLIESTDPQRGFVTRSSERQERLTQYAASLTADPNTDAYQYDFTIQESIGLTELAGLSYFNEAVAYYNQQQFQQAITLLQQATQLYSSQRMEAFRSLVEGVVYTAKKR